MASVECVNGNVYVSDCIREWRECVPYCCLKKKLSEARKKISLCRMTCGTKDIIIIYRDFLWPTSTIIEFGHYTPILGGKGGCKSTTLYHSLYLSLSLYSILEEKNHYHHNMVTWWPASCPIVTLFCLARTFPSLHLSIWRCSIGPDNHNTQL